MAGSPTAQTDESHAAGMPPPGEMDWLHADPNRDEPRDRDAGRVKRREHSAGDME